MKFWTFLMALIALVTAAVPVLAAEAECKPWPVMVETMADRFQEELIFRGTDSAGKRVAVFAGRGGSWSVVLVSADGQTACLVAYGLEWVGQAPPAQGVEG